jgi:hypothetical protein
MSLSTRNLDDLDFFKTSYLDWRTLSKKITMAKLAELAASPTVYFPAICQSNCVSFSTSKLSDFRI